MIDKTPDRWNELREFNSMHGRFPIQKRVLRGRSREATRRNGPPVTFDDVLRFHEELTTVYGVDKNERDFFARFSG